jgi:hypothetical protein
MDWTTLHTYDRACTREGRHSRDVAVDRGGGEAAGFGVGMGMAKPPPGAVKANGQQQRQDGWLGGEAFEGGHQQI